MRGQCNPAGQAFPAPCHTGWAAEPTWANGTTDTAGEFRVDVPANLCAPQSFVPVGAHAPGDHPMVATGQIYGFALPVASGTARVGVV